MKKIFGKKKATRQLLQDRIYGGFKFHAEDDHIKIKGASDLVSWRLHRDSIPGRLIEMGMKDNDEGGMHNYASVIHSALSVCPDMQLLTDFVNAINACVERHRDLYPVKEDITKEEDDAILKEEKEMQEAIEESSKD